MDANRSTQELSSYAEDCVRNKARQLVDSGVFPESDREDVEQELRLALLQSLPKYNPAKARPNTFASRVVSRRATSLVRAKLAGRRASCREECSLDQSGSDDEDALQSVESKTDADRDRRLGRSSMPDEELASLTLDVADVLVTLAGELRQLCSGIQHRNLHQLSRETGIPRRTLRRRIKVLRRRFREVGLEEYLDSRRPISPATA